MLNLPTLVKNFSENAFFERFNLLVDNKRILNAGSSNTRYGNNCVNIDIQEKENVDIVGDLHQLPPSIGKFDGIVCLAVLQYCKDPCQVADQFYEALYEGGYLLVDAPWIQPFCLDTLDLHRYSDFGLREIFKRFEIIECEPSIRPGSAFAMLGEYIAGSLTGNRYVNFALAKMAAVVLLQFRWIRTHQEAKCAGAFYLIARKNAAAMKPSTQSDATPPDVTPPVPGSMSQ